MTLPGEAGVRSYPSALLRSRLRTRRGSGQRIAVVHSPQPIPPPAPLTRLRRKAAAAARSRGGLGTGVRVAIGADHGGFELKIKLVSVLRTMGCVVADLGAHTPEPCDYPAIGAKVATAVASGTFDRGVLVCKSGIGIAIVANKVPGVRAAVCHDRFDAEYSRRHNDANVLVLGAEKIAPRRAVELLKIWFETAFESGGRHERRVKQIQRLERKLCANAPSRTPTGRN